MRAEWLTTPAQLAALAPRWDIALARANPDNPFLLADFLLTWAAHFTRADQLRILTLWQDAELMGGWPLYRTRRLDRPQLAVLRPVGLGFANLTEPFHRVPAAEFFAAACAALRALPGWSYLSLPLARARFWQGGGRLAWREGGEVTGARLLVEGAAADYLRARRPSLQVNLRRGLRRAAAFGPLELRREDDPAAIAAMIEFQLRHNGPDRYPEDREVLPSRPAWAAFTRQILTELAAQGRLDAMALRLGGELAAVGFGIRHGPGYKSLLVSYDPRFRACGPGLLFFYHLIDWCWQRGDPWLDMYADGQEFDKQRWCHEFPPLHRLWLFAPTLCGQALYQGFRLWQR